MKGRCRGCGAYVTIDIPPDGHTFAPYLPPESTEPVGGLVLCGPVDKEEVMITDYLIRW